MVLIGSLAPHKNIGLVLSLANKLAAAGLRIAVAGIRDERVFNASKPVPQQTTLYGLADCLMMSSRPC